MSYSAGFFTVVISVPARPRNKLHGARRTLGVRCGQREQGTEEKVAAAECTRVVVKQNCSFCLRGVCCCASRSGQHHSPSGVFPAEGLATTDRRRRASPQVRRVKSTWEAFSKTPFPPSGTSSCRRSALLKAQAFSGRYPVLARRCGHTGSQVRRRVVGTTFAFKYS